MDTDSTPDCDTIALASDRALRREVPADRSFALALYVEARTPELAAVPWSALDRLRFLTDQFAAQEAHYRAHHPNADRWIVLHADEPVGRLYVARAARWWGLLDIGVVATAREQRIGTALIGWVIGEAAQARAGVELHVVPDNARAIALYRRLGFREVPPHPASRLRMRKAAPEI